MNKALHHPDRHKVRLRNQNKRRLPQMLHRSPIVPTGLHYWSTGKRNNIKNTIFIELLLELGCIICTVQRHLQAGFGSICESRGLGNLTPSRSRLFKLIGRVKGMRWSCRKRLAYLVSNICKWEREEKAKARSNNYDQEVIQNYLRQALLQHRVHFPDTVGKRPSR